MASITPELYDVISRIVEDKVKDIKVNGEEFDRLTQRVDQKAMVTGGAGFIGSHLVDHLMSHGAEVVVIDDLSSGSMENLGRWLSSEGFEFVKADLSAGVPTLGRVDAIYHLAANPEVRIGSEDPGLHYRANVLTTFNVLEYARRHDVELLAFASTSTVYGEPPPSAIPTREDYGPLEPISVYGASKLASEALISAYAHSYGIRSVVFRLANVVGPRSRHGVIHDFIAKLRRNPAELEVLGDGTQSKSYLHVEDCVDAMALATERGVGQGPLSVYNVGSEDTVGVLRIAEVVMEEMGVRANVKVAGGPEGRGWIGDVKAMLLDVSRMKSLGWRPRTNSEGAVRKAVREILAGQGGGGGGVHLALS